MTKRFIVIYNYEKPTDGSTEYIKTPCGVKCILTTKYRKYEAVSRVQGTDVFNFELGKEIASRKVDVQIAEDRLKKSKNQLAMYRANFEYMMDIYDRACKFNEKRIKEFNNAKSALNNLMSEVNK